LSKQKEDLGADLKENLGAADLAQGEDGSQCSADDESQCSAEQPPAEEGTANAATTYPNGRIRVTRGRIDADTVSEEFRIWGRHAYYLAVGNPFNASSQIVSLFFCS
jgi:hypothetical protein